MESSSQIEQQDWRKVSKQHPFYQEAAKVVSGKLEEKQDKTERSGQFESDPKVIVKIFHDFPSRF